MRLMENERYIASLEAMLSDVDLSFLQGKRTLITGATGMLGSCLVDALMLWNQDQSEPCEVVSVGRNLSAAQERFDYCWSEPYFSFFQQDVCIPIQGFPEMVDYIIHAASNADPVRMAAQPVETLLANVTGTHHLLEYGRTHGMKRFLYVSSGEFYGQPDTDLSAFAEDYCGPLDHSSPRACYPAGKRAAEVLCQSYISEYGTDAVIVRPCHLFGPTMRRSDSRAVAEFLWSAAEGKDIVLKSAGLLERSHCYVVDAVKAMLLVLKNGICGEAYNIADRQYQMTIRAFAEQAAAAGGCKVVFENPSDLEARGYSKVARAVLDVTQLENLAWKPQGAATIEETVKILYETR